jgi:hypothetical protein
MGWSTKTIELFRGTVPLNPTSEDIFLLWDSHAQPRKKMWFAALPSWPAGMQSRGGGGNWADSLPKIVGGTPPLNIYGIIMGGGGAICY